MSKSTARPRALAFALAALCACGASEPAAPPPPSVLLISIDMLRADHVSSYGYARETTPTIDALAERGARFAETISSAPWTLPAHTALFTSLSDSVHGVSDGVGRALAPEVTTLAECYAAASYATGGFFAGPYLHEAYGLGQGFDVYRYCVDYAADYGRDAVEDWGADPAAQRRSHHGVTNPGVYDAAKGWLDALPADQPFFGFVHLWDAHYDFTPPAPYDSMFADPAYAGWVTGEEFFFDPRIRAGMDAADYEQLVALYDGEIRWTDAFVRKLVEDLERLGRAENTIIVVTSDHGTELFDHGSKGHRRTLYDEALKVPLVMAGPGIPRGLTLKPQVSLLDVAPSLLELCGLGRLEGAMGVSLVPLLRGESMEARTAVAELLADGKSLRALRSPGRKLVQQLGTDEHALFDLAQDPSEASVAEESPEEQAASAQQLRELEAELAGWQARTPRPVAPGALPEPVQDALKANGYVGSADEDDD